MLPNLNHLGADRQCVPCGAPPDDEARLWEQFEAELAIRRDGIIEQIVADGLLSATMRRNERLAVVQKQIERIQRDFAEDVEASQERARRIWQEREPAMRRDFAKKIEAGQV
jgi:hypothetical protein